MPGVLVGIFVGGKGERFGGAAKGLLPSLDTQEPLIERLRRVASTAVPEARVVLVGQRSEYATLGLDCLADDPPGIGPLGGLLALLREAERGGHDCCLALACDLPFVDAPLVSRLMTHAPGAAAVAPRPDACWQPLCARYATLSTLTAAETVHAKGRRALHAVLEQLGEHAVALPVSAAEAHALRDWDSPKDVERDLSRDG